MNAPSNLAEFARAYPEQDLNWVRVTGSPRFDYPIDYSVAVLNVDPKTERVEFLSRWEANCYCHFHRHLGETSVLVLEGEHHIVETNDNETVHKKRLPGYFTTNPGGDVHMEYGGAEGTLVYFNCQAKDGKLFDVLDAEGRVLNTAMVEDFTGGKIGK